MDREKKLQRMCKKFVQEHPLSCPADSYVVPIDSAGQPTPLSQAVAIGLWPRGAWSADGHYAEDVAEGVLSDFLNLPTEEDAAQELRELIHDFLAKKATFADLKAAVSPSERYWVYYNRGTGLAAVMPYDPDEVFPLGEVTYQNQAPGPHYDVVGDFAAREEAEAEKERLELPLYE